MNPTLYLIAAVAATGIFFLVIHRRGRQKMERHFSTQRAKLLLGIAQDFNNLMGENGTP